MLPYRKYRFTHKMSFYAIGKVTNSPRTTSTPAIYLVNFKMTLIVGSLVGVIRTPHRIDRDSNGTMIGLL